MRSCCSAVYLAKSISSLLHLLRILFLGENACARASGRVLTAPRRFVRKTVIPVFVTVSASPMLFSTQDASVSLESSGIHAR